MGGGGGGHFLSFCILSSSAFHGGVSFFEIPLGFICISWFSITPIIIPILIDWMLKKTSSFLPVVLYPSERVQT